MRRARLAALLGGLCLCIRTGGEPAGNRITILYDAFTNRPGLTCDWGYAALVEFEGKRILFDTGNNAAIFDANIRRLGVDLDRLDAVVLSHRHGDHTAGLGQVLHANPRVAVYAPADEAFTGATPEVFFTRNADPELPAKMRYFSGKAPAPPPPHGTAWPGADIQVVPRKLDVTDRIHLVGTMSEKPGMRDLPELSLVLDTARGPIVVVGCSHPGIENILASVTREFGARRTYEVIGGMHLVVAPPAEMDRTAAELIDRYHVQRVAPGHCTGERLFALFQKRFGKDYVYAGLGESFPL